MSNLKRQQRPLSRTLLLMGALPAVVMFIVLMVFVRQRPDACGQPGARARVRRGFG